MSVPHPLHRYGCRCGIIPHALLWRGPAQRTQRIHLLCSGLSVTSRVSSFPVDCSVLCPQVIGLVYRPYVVVQSNSSSTDVSCSWLAVWSCVHRGRRLASVVQTKLWQYSPRAGPRFMCPLILLDLTHTWCFHPVSNSFKLISNSWCYRNVHLCIEQYVYHWNTINWDCSWLAL